MSVLRAASLAEAPSRQDTAPEKAVGLKTDRLQRLAAEVAFLTHLTKALQSLPSLGCQVSRWIVVKGTKVIAFMHHIYSTQISK